MRPNDEQRKQVLSGEDDQQGLWGEQGERNIHTNPDSEAQAQRIGTVNRAERISLSGSDSTGRSGSEEQFTQSLNSGGIRGQLKEFFELFLEYVHAHRDRLEARLSENLSFEDKLVQAYERLDDRLSQLARQDNTDSE